MQLHVRILSYNQRKHLTCLAVGSGVVGGAVTCRRVSGVHLATRAAILTRIVQLTNQR